ncbi:DUF998 domain-containing protein [Paenibacillus sp. FSL W8-1187]|uniref:DUF998 domain-containing protein n=1 Tax=unclassified Paenibacillus TaxID=185978 RepID=UPI00129B4E03|nr:DUF998 domain-containing protein [Paenibacillus sp. B01]QGG54986.1 DUF998 domain-containing protein [Paenibacillus sp. B01]
MIQKPVLAKPLTEKALRLALASVFCSGLFVVLLVSLHLLQPEFDPTWRFISEYALGDFGWIMHLAFGLLGTAQICVALAIVPHVRSVAGSIGLVILGISAIGVAIAGIFATDPISIHPDDATFSGSMHSIGAMLDYTPAAALFISLSLGRLEAWRPVKKALIASSVLAIVAMLAFVLQIPQDGQFGPEVRTGLYGRFLILTEVAWLLLVGSHAAKLARLNSNR